MGGSVSAQDLALITGITAIVAAIIGATSSGIISALTDRARRKRQAKAGARLVALDLAVAAGQVESAEVEGRWFVFYELKMDAWPEYRDVLAATLTNEEFERVSKSVTGLPHLGKGMNRPQVMDHGIGYYSLRTEAATGLRLVREQATDAYNDLAKLAGHTRVEGLLHEGKTKPPTGNGTPADRAS